MKKADSKHMFNALNERAKYKYRVHLKCVRQRDEKTIIDALKHIRDYELFTDFAGFETYNGELANRYIRSLFQRDLSKSYISDNIRILREFLRWLERQRGYKSKIDYNQIDYLNISKNQMKEAKAMKYPKTYKYNQIIEAIRKMPNVTDKEKRDRAIVSLQALCTLRISELRTVKMESLIEEDGSYFVYVSPHNMSVKFAKTRQACFVPLPKDIIANVIEWFDYLKTLGFKNSDPLFPVVDNRFTETNLLRQTIRKDEIKSATTIRDIFKKAFQAAGFEYINPHSFRRTIAQYAQTQSPAFLNAVRQNLGHDSIDTTLSSYGHLSNLDQRKIISSISIQ